MLIILLSDNSYWALQQDAGERLRHSRESTAVRQFLTQSVQDQIYLLK